jgi:endonuclease IV
MMIQYGYHASSEKKLSNTLMNFLKEKESKLNGDENFEVLSLQIYSGNKLSKESKHYDEIDILESKKIIKDNKLNFFIHGSLTLSLTNQELFEVYSKDMIIDYLNLLDKVGGKGVVIHPGSYTKTGYEESMENIVKNVKSILKNRKNKPECTSKIILENCAGENGKTMGRMEEFRYIFENLREYFELGLVSFCIDTCHLFAQGEYDISDIKEIDRFKQDWKNNIEKTKYIELFHLNDSMKAFDCHADRHDSLGKGYIWKKANLLHFLDTFKKIIFIAEEDTKKNFESISYIKKIL